MPSLSLKLLGAFEARLDDDPIDELRSKPAQALLIYLAVEGKITHQRDFLCSLLWPEMPEKSARHNLSQAQYALRQAFPQVSAIDDPDERVPLILADRQSVQLNPAGSIEADIYQIDHLLDGIQIHDHINLGNCERCIQAMEGAAGLYHGDFLSDFFLEDSAPFEDWAQANREIYRRKILGCQTKLSNIYIQKADYERARSYAQQQIDIDPLRESAYQQLMQLHAKGGQRAEALRTYQRCADLLELELGTQPSPETSALFEIIRAEGSPTPDPS